MADKKKQHWTDYAWIALPAALAGAVVEVVVTAWVLGKQAKKG